VVGSVNTHVTDTPAGRPPQHKSGSRFPRRRPILYLTYTSARRRTNNNLLSFFFLLTYMHLLFETRFTSNDNNDYMLCELETNHSKTTFLKHRPFRIQIDFQSQGNFFAVSLLSNVLRILCLNPLNSFVTFRETLDVV